MTDPIVTGRARGELWKYRLTFALAVTGLALAGWMFQTAFLQHINLLNAGDKTGGRLLQMRGLDQAVKQP